MSDERNIATAADFRERMARERGRRAELVRLPSGLTVKLVRPTPGEMFLRSGKLPQSVAARIAGGSAEIAGDDLIRIAQQTVDLCRFIFFEPRVPDELEPGFDICYEDVEFALRWGRGEVAPDGNTGRDLAEFRRGESE
jgi:hypothetical protein